MREREGERERKRGRGKGREEAGQIAGKMGRDLVVGVVVDLLQLLLQSLQGRELLRRLRREGRRGARGQGDGGRAVRCLRWEGQEACGGRCCEAFRCLHGLFLCRYSLPSRHCALAHHARLVTGRLLRCMLLLLLLLLHDAERLLLYGAGVAWRCAVRVMIVGHIR